jgi:6-phosphogluconolactonase
VRRLYVGAHRRAYHSDPQDIGLGLYQFDLDGAPAAGHLTPSPQPGWVAVHPNGGVLYAVNEVSDFESGAGGGVSAFAMDPATGHLTLLNSRPTLPRPCHCAVDSTGRFLLVATFVGGSVHLFLLDPDGRIGPEADAHRHGGSSIHPRRQAAPHAHAVAFDPAERFVLVPDLGTDEVRVYELDRAGMRLVPRPERTRRLPPGSGPRHLDFSADGRFAYLMNEMSAMVGVFAYDQATGALSPLQTIDLLPEGFAGHRSGAAIAVHPGGRFLYATTRSHGSSGEPAVRGLDSLSWFEIDPATGELAHRGTIPSGGEIPRSFVFDKAGDTLFVGHQSSGTVVTFRIDRQSGAPVATNQVIETPVPVCLHLIEHA